MREILFRGKRLDNGEWVEGNLVLSRDVEDDFEAIIIPQTESGMFTKHSGFKDISCYLGFDEWRKVIPETIGQWTGLVDKNGMKVFEGDEFNIEDEIVGTVVFKDGCFRIEEYGICGMWTESGYDECGGGYGIIQCQPIDWYSICDMEVTGNIHDKVVEAEVEE